MDERIQCQTQTKPKNEMKFKRQKDTWREREKKIINLSLSIMYQTKKNEKTQKKNGTEERKKGKIITFHNFITLLY